MISSSRKIPIKNKKGHMKSIDAMNSMPCKSIITLRLSDRNKTFK